VADSVSPMEELIAQLTALRELDAKYSVSFTRWMSVDLRPVREVRWMSEHVMKKTEQTKSNIALMKELGAAGRFANRTFRVAIDQKDNSAVGALREYVETRTQILNDGLPLLLAGLKRAEALTHEITSYIDAELLNTENSKGSKWWRRWR
jgi:hypothetical protein